MNKLIAELEILRGKVAVRLILTVIISVICGFVVLTAAAGSFTGEDGVEFAILVSVLSGAIVYFTMYFSLVKKVRKEYIFRFKNEIVHSVLSEIFEDIEFNHEACFSKEEVKETYLVPIGNRYRGDDLLSGTYRGVKFRQCDIDNKHVTSSGKHSQTITYFKGKWIQFDYKKKKLEGYLQIREKEFGGASKVYSLFSSMPLTENVKTESIEFNKHFEIKAEKPHTAFYLLTPHFMELIVSLIVRVEGQISIAFVNGVLNIAIHNKQNAFEPTIFMPLDSNIEEEIKSQAKIIKDVIDALKLDE